MFSYCAMIYPSQLTVQLRQRQLQDIYGNNIVFAGATPLTLTPAAGTVSSLWVDYTDFIQGIDKLSLSWSTTQTPTGQVDEGEFRPKKGVSGTLTFERDAYEFLKRILVEDVAAPLNQVEVQITDVSCGTFSGYVIRASHLSWCEFNSTCTYDLNLKQEDVYTQCIERTMIADNWQGWFQTEPEDIPRTPPGGIPPKKYHPRFSYCVESRPNGNMIMIWYLLGILSITVVPILIVVYAFYNSLIFAINSVIFAINGVIGTINIMIGVLNSLSGGSIATITPLAFLPYAGSLRDINESWSQLYIESAGCGREHPAPLIRDYITNVCDRCGIQVNAATADVFFAPIISVQKSDGITYDEPNPHYNACLFFPAVKRGIRRYKELSFYSVSPMDTTTYYQTENQPIWALSDLLDYLNNLYNQRWRVIAQPDGTGAIVPFLYIKRKDWFQNQAPLFDFSKGGADRHKILEGVCYSPTDYKIPASCSGLYKDDPADKCGHEASMPMNGDPLSFNNTIVNPMFFGILDKQSNFAATKFRLDGASTDYIYDAAQVLINGSWSSSGLEVIGMSVVSDYVQRYCDYAILLQTETVTLPKVIIWDGLVTTEPGNPYLNARALRKTINIAGTSYDLGKTALTGTVPDIGEPDINPLYPSQVPTTATTLATLAAPSTVPTLLSWYAKYPPKTKVLGSSISAVGAIAGKYTVRSYIGTPIFGPSAAILVNYPMYFEPYYKDSLWDWFHWIDDPYKNPRLHKNWSLKIPMCCEDMNKLRLFGDGTDVRLLDTVTLDTDYYNSGVITDVEVGYDVGASGVNYGTGQYLQLKGFV